MKKELKIRLRNILIYSLPLGGGLGWGCSSALDDTVAEQPRPCTAVSINAGISGDVEAETRAVLTGTSFPQNSTIGIFVSKHGTNEAFSLNMHNIRGTQTESNTQVWKFNYENNTDTQFPYIYIIGDRKNLVNADIYAYAPWKANVTDISAIPFTLETTALGSGTHLTNDATDLKYAIQNAQDNPANKDIRPGKYKMEGSKEVEDGIDNKTIDLTFKHALSLIRFNMKITGDAQVNGTGTVRVNNIDFYPNNENFKIYQSGTFNAITGEVNPKTSSTTDKLSYVCKTGDHDGYITTNTYRQYNMPFVPYQISSSLPDDAVVMTVKIISDTSYELFNLPITKGMLKHKDDPILSQEPGYESTYGLQPNYVYTFNFTIENFLHLDQVEVDTEWTEGTAPEKSV